MSEDVVTRVLNVLIAHSEVIKASTFHPVEAEIPVWWLGYSDVNVKLGHYADIHCGAANIRYQEDVRFVAGVASQIETRILDRRTSGPAILAYPADIPFGIVLRNEGMVKNDVGNYVYRTSLALRWRIE